MSGWPAVALLLAAVSQVAAAAVLLRGLREVRRVLMLLEQRRADDVAKVDKVRGR